MGSFFVVVIPPGFCKFPDFRQVSENISVKYAPSVASVEAFNVTVLGGFARLSIHNQSETINYKYNVRSWLTQINGNKFHQTLLYNNFENNIIPHSLLYNGNISSVRWRAGNETILRGYNFNYDNLNRLSVAHYGEVNPAGEGGFINVNPNLFNEEATYDKMGNITTLQRRGKVTSSTYNLIDNLTYTYTGNQLTKVTDAVTTSITNESTLHFVDGANVDNEYVYDANGNLIKDLNKNITLITYNYLNLPNVITFADGNTITYDYDANGSKLSVAYKIGDNIAKTEYVGNKVYKNGTLSMILTEEGYITMNGTTPTYHYFLKDHQGNNRVVINQSGTVLQVNHYYPFGGQFGEGLQDSNQSYKYNGKEFDDLLGLNMYDYGARHYDPYSGRWIAVDPLVEKYYSISPYVYVVNNPVRFIDPDGRIITLPKGTSTENIYLVLGNLQKLTNDRLVYSTQKDGIIRIKVASLGEGNKTAGTNLIRRLNSSNKTMTIQIGNPGSGNIEVDVNSTNAINGKGTDVNIYFDPTSDPSIMTKDPKTGNVSGKKRPNQIGLAHEIIHGERSMRGEAIDYNEWGTQTYKDAFGKIVTEPVRKEEAATSGIKYHTKKDITENDIREEQGQNKRGAY